MTTIDKQYTISLKSISWPKSEKLKKWYGEGGKRSVHKQEYDRILFFFNSYPIIYSGGILVVKETTINSKNSTKHRN